MGVRGATSSGSEMEAGCGAASEGRMGVEVWRSKGGARERSSVGWAQGLIGVSGMG